MYLITENVQLYILNNHFILYQKDIFFSGKKKTDKPKLIGFMQLTGLEPVPS